METKQLPKFEATVMAIKTAIKMLTDENERLLTVRDKLWKVSDKQKEEGENWVPANKLGNQYDQAETSLSEAIDYLRVHIEWISNL